MNGAVEAANKNVKKIIQKMVVTYKDWHEMWGIDVLYSGFAPSCSIFFP
jgi:hypothetical protein